MICRECREWIDDLLRRDPDAAPPDEITRHLAGCQGCAREHALARETLRAITPAGPRAAAPQLKGRIVAAIPIPMREAPATATADPPGATNPRRRRTLRVPPVAVMVAAVLLAMALFPLWIGPPRPSNRGVLSLLSQASAAEAVLFDADGIVSVSGAIDVEPMDDPEQEESRWLPMVVVEADGKPRIFQLTLGSDPGGAYTVRDESWFDPGTARFAHVLMLKDRPIFANSYDGRSVHLLEVDDQGKARITSDPVAPSFRAPRNPAEFLGTFAALIRDFDRPDRQYVPHDEGRTKLADGTTARVVRLKLLVGEDNPMSRASLRVIVRDDNHRVESFEFVDSGRTLFRVRRTESAGRREPPCGWDLAGLRPSIEKDQGGARPPVQALADLVRLDLTIDEVAKRSDDPVYVLGRDPGWTSWRQVIDILDLASPPHRMSAIVYPAKDKRHVLLVQAHSFNANMGPKARAGKLLYTTPSGIKVWSNPDGPKMADILLTSIRSAGIVADAPAEDRTCFLLETPEGTFPALAVNGTLTDAELHGVVDSLVRARGK